MTSEQVQQIIDLLTNTASVIAREGFSLLVKYQMLMGLKYLIGVILAIASLVWSVRFKKFLSSNSVEKWAEDLGIGDDEINTFRIFVHIPIVISVIAGLLYLFESVAHLLLPQWYAVQQLIGMIER